MAREAGLFRYVDEIGGKRKNEKSDFSNKSRNDTDFR